MRIINSLCAVLVTSLLCVSALASNLSSKQAASKIFPSGTQFLFIGDPWNVADELGNGFCPRNFLLGAYEWTVRDWKEKVLDQVACKVDVNNEDPTLRIADPRRLWNNGMKTWIARKGTATKGYVYSIKKGAENLPITYVNLFDSCRACNVMQRVKELGDRLGLEGKSLEEVIQYFKEHQVSLVQEGESFDEVTERGGAYFITINEKTKKQEALRAVSCSFYIPNQSEWIKAAYYKGGGTHAGYSMYPTRLDSPNPEGRDSSIKNNRANYNVTPGWYFGPSLELSEVNYCGGFDENGKAQGTYSSYHCFDMGGNVNEWTTTKVEINWSNDIEFEDNGLITSESDNIHYRYPVRGGDYESMYTAEPGIDNLLMRTCTPEQWDPNVRIKGIGFRMAAVEDVVNPVSMAFDHEGNHIDGWWHQCTTGERTVMVVGATTVGAAAAMGGAVAAGVVTGTTLAAEGVLAFSGAVGEAIGDGITAASTAVWEAIGDGITATKSLLTQVVGVEGTAAKGIIAEEGEGAGVTSNVASEEFEKRLLAQGSKEVIEDESYEVLPVSNDKVAVYEDLSSTLKPKSSGWDWTRIKNFISGNWR